MRLVKETVSCLARSCPAICHARNAALVELDRPMPQSNLLKPLLMQHGEKGEGYRRYQ